MDAIPNIGWEDLATHADLGLLRGDLRLEMSELRSELRSEIAGLESRLQRSMITWIIGAQGVTLATISILVTVLTLTR